MTEIAALERGKGLEAAPVPAGPGGGAELPSSHPSGEGVKEPS